MISTLVLGLLLPSNLCKHKQAINRVVGDDDDYGLPALPSPMHYIDDLRVPKNVFIN